MRLSRRFNCFVCKEWYFSIGAPTCSEQCRIKSESDSKKVSLIFDEIRARESLEKSDRAMIKLERIRKRQAISSASIPKKDQAKRGRKKKNNAIRKISFYDSPEWQSLRYKALKHYGRKCGCCHTTEGEMHVDHIKPRSIYPALELSFENLQILCRACNMGKGNSDEIDYRCQK